MSGMIFILISFSSILYLMENKYWLIFDRKILDSNLLAMKQVFKMTGYLNIHTHIIYKYKKVF